ncbi:MAG: malonate decarboxylase acyl carrier protein [Qingshengfaniella sp.]
MEKLTFSFPGGAQSGAGHKAVTAGVVGSGQLEVLIEPRALDGTCVIHVESGAPGFGAIWEAVLTDFQARRGFSDVEISINDGGATPAVVTLRLEQAAEEFLAS